MATAETVTFDANGEKTAGYLARPEGDGNGAAILLVHEWWGLDDHIKDVARRYADEGFVALAPDLYRGVVTKDPAEASRLMHALAPDDGVATLKAAIDWLTTEGGADVARVGATGFCMGGSFALLVACRDERIRAAAPFYGDVPSDEDLANLRGPVLFVAGSEDKWINPEKTAGLEASLDRLNKPGEVRTYQGADHAFFNDTRPEVYDADKAADAWARVVEFFTTNL